MAPPDRTLAWAAFELDRRLKRADTLKEKAQVWEDASRARTDPEFMSRLAQIAEHGKWSSGAPKMTKYALAAGTLAGMFPPLLPLGVASGAALAGLAIPTGLEAMERRKEGLPWMGQAIDASLDVGFPVGARLLRGLRGLRGVKEGAQAVKGAPSVTRTDQFDLRDPGIFRAGQTYTDARAYRPPVVPGQKVTTTGGPSGRPVDLTGSGQTYSDARAYAQRGGGGFWRTGTDPWMSGRPLEGFGRTYPTGADVPGARVRYRPRTTTTAGGTPPPDAARPPGGTPSPGGTPPPGAAPPPGATGIYRPLITKTAYVPPTAPRVPPTAPRVPEPPTSTQVSLAINSAADDIVESASKVAKGTPAVVKTQTERVAMADKAEAFLGGRPTSTDVIPGVGTAERRAVISPSLATPKGATDVDAVQMQALREVALMVGRGTDEVFEAFGSVGPALARKATTTVPTPGAQRGLLREVVAPTLAGGAQAAHGSSLAYMFASRPSFRPGGGKKALFEVFKEGLGPASKTAKSKGPRLFETWFKNQSEIFGKAEFYRTRVLNTKAVRDFASKLHSQGSDTPYTPAMLTKIRNKPSTLIKGTAKQYMNPEEALIHDQAVMFSIIAQRGGMLKKVMTHTTRMSGRIPEFQGAGEKDILNQMTGAYQTFMKEGTFKGRQSIVDAANNYTQWISMLLASIAGAEMMALSGDPRATAR